MTKRVMAGLPDDLYAWLARQAADNHRSISNQIVYLLEVARSKGES